MDDKRALIEVTERWEKVYMKGDIDACVSFYAENAVMMTFDGVIARGRGEIRDLYKMWQQVGPPKKFEYETLLSEVRGDVGYPAMRWSGVYPEPQGEIARSGTALSVLERQPDGAWRWTAEIVSADLE